MPYIMEPAAIHPMTERMHAKALGKLSTTCTAWRDAAGPAVWRALCVLKWPSLQCFSIRSCDWKKRYATLSQCGAPDASPAFNIDDYEFFISARLARPPAGAVEAVSTLFSCTATWESKEAYTTYGDGGGRPATGLFLKATLPSPLVLPEGLLTASDEDGEAEMLSQPLHFTVHVHHKPLGTVAHMLGFQVPDSDFDYDSLDYNLESRIAGVGAGDWQPRMQEWRRADGTSESRDRGFCYFEPPDWLCHITANFGSGNTSDKLMVWARLELDEESRLVSVEFVPGRYGDEDVGLGPAPFWEVPLGFKDLPAVCWSLKWA